MGDYSSFYKYEKYEVIGDELIPLGIFSVDGDGTMPLVAKEECDVECGCPQPIYRWIQTEDTVCIEVITRTTTGTPYCSGDDLYADVTVEESIDDGDTWEVVSTTPTLVEEGGCASPEVQYRWVAIGTTCSNGNKYQNNIKQVSTDGGHTWEDVVPAEYSASTLIESNSYDCGYRTSATTSATYCSNANQYVDVYSLVSRDYGVTWSTASTSTELIEEDVYECGYRTRTTTGESYCSNANEYAYTYNEVSRDSGNTWTTASTSSVLVQSDSYNCGYRTGTTSSSTYCNGDDLYVDVYYRVSRDTGTTWVTASTTPTLVEAGGCATPASPKFTLTLNDSSVVSAECDSTSAITENEVSAYTGSVVSAVIGDCVTEIGGVAFGNCASLSSIVIPNSVTSIGYWAIGDCSGLTSVTIPNSVTSIDSYAFLGCSRLTSITCLATTPPTLGLMAFDNTNNCPIYVPCASVSAYQTAWSDYSSRIQCLQLKYLLTLSDSSTVTAACDSTSAITENEISAYTSSIVSVAIGDCVTNIGNNTFKGCANVKSIEIPSGVTSIGDNAFSGCTSFVSISCLADTPPTLGTNVFNDTNNCTIYVRGANISAYQSAWSDYSSRLNSKGNPIEYGKKYRLNLSDSSTITAACDSTSAVTSGDVSTYRNTATGATFGACCTTIGDSSFSGFTSLSRCVMGYYIDLIGNDAFNGCSQLSEVIIKSSTPPTLGNNAFDGSSCLISVQFGCLNKYKFTTDWGKYSSRIVV